MVHLRMSLCLGNKVPLSQPGHCPWLLLCGELATQLKARFWGTPWALQEAPLVAP